MSELVRNSEDALRLDRWNSLVDSDRGKAVDELRAWIRGHPLDAQAYRILARALDTGAGESNVSGQIRTTVRDFDPDLARASNALTNGDLETAEIILRGRLLERPADAIALHLMAKFAAALAFPVEAIALLKLALEWFPGLPPARYDLAVALHARNESAEALEVLAPLLAAEPDNAAAVSLSAAALFRAGRFDAAIAEHERALALAPNDSMLWWTYGHHLKTIGRAADGAAAMRKAVQIAPNDGESWWNLSNMKTTEFSSGDIQTMRDALAVSTSDRNSAHLHFALGKALEDAGEFGQAFDHYVNANAFWRATFEYDPDEVTEEVTSAARTFTAEFLATHEQSGNPAPDPIFIVGMTRAGSTLVEQILACHSAIEGTMELPYMGQLAKDLGRRQPGYFERLTKIAPNALRRVGDEYLQRATKHRRSGEPYFTDKMPNNWLHVGLIMLALPNAKIIDVRRHPLACGVSNFRQHFVRGQQFTYDLGWFGRFYYDYVRLLAHFDAVRPGRVHRVIYEELVANPDREIRRLLDYVGVPFEEACLRHHESERPVFTPSSEQVRQPIDAKKATSWRVYDERLSDLKAALGPVLECYPKAPDFEKV